MSRSLKGAARTKARRALRKKSALRLVKLAIKRRTAELDARLAKQAQFATVSPVYLERTERVKQILGRLADDRANLIRKLNLNIVEEHEAEAIEKDPRYAP